MTRSNKPLEYSQVVSIERISIDPSFQVRERLNRDTIKRYADIVKTGGSLPPVRLANIDGTFQIIDGWHRLAAHVQLGLSFIEANIVEASLEEAKWLAASANLKHGLPLKKKELRNVFRVYIESKQNVKRNRTLKSYREISADLGIIHTTVHNWMNRDFPYIAKKMAGDEASQDRSIPPELDRPSTAEALALIDEVMDHFRASGDQSYRGEIVEKMRTCLKAMEDAKGWIMPPPAPF